VHFTRHVHVCEPSELIPTLPIEQISTLVLAKDVGSANKAAAMSRHSATDNLLVPPQEDAILAGNAMIDLSRSTVHFLAMLVALLMLGGCNRVEQQAADSVASGSLLEPPGHAPGEPHSFIECPDGACPREQPAYLFSGEFHEAVVDLRVASCGVGLDLVWARRYRSRVMLPAGQTPLGNNWDHSYNIYVQVPEGNSDSTITIHDGNARPAQFVHDEASGIYWSPGYHREGAFDEHGRFVLRFADGGEWVFKSVEDSARSDIRRLAQIIDRNGNVVHLDYDDADRLEQVSNSTGQSLELEYDTTDHITAVTAKLDAQTERRVLYQRYQPGEVGGTPSDLARVTLPGGTTTTYTYSTGFADPALDGNLLTIADSLGRVYLRNTYASTTDPREFEFDHLVHQVWGEDDDVIAIVYAPVSPAADNGQAVRTAWLNDRVGRVSEHYFNASNQLVLLREYTGFAEPGLSTHAFTNRPTGKLRAEDPAYFETRYAHNADGHVTWVLNPRGNVTRSVYEADINPEASPRMRGNLRAVHQEAGFCEAGLATISEHFEYADGLGNEHGEMNFVVRAEDPRGHVTIATYDEAGNRTAIVHPEPNVREDMQYDLEGRLTSHVFPEDQHGHRRELVHIHENDGRRQTTIEDPLGLALTTVKVYDAACNEIRRIDPRGQDVFYTYDQRDQLIREIGPLAGAYTDRHYDANGNLVRVDYQARDCDGSLQADPVISTHYEYDILNELIATRQDLGDGSELVTEFQLDANREQVVLRYGEAASGADPFNTLTIVYDERGLPFREIRGAGSSVISTTQHDYDANGNEIATHEGLEGPVQTTAYSFDCADRLVTSDDSMGNRTEFDHDPAGNVIERRLFGELVDAPGAAQNVLLERVSIDFDAMNRPVTTVRDHFDPATQTPIGEGQSVTQVVYDGESRVIREIDANGNQTDQEFDTAGRKSKTIDPAGNTTEFVYDAAGNVRTRVQTDVATDGGNPQIRVWHGIYDARNNLIASSDPLGNTSFTCYDSLGRTTAEIDERGNSTLHRYDGAGRLLETRFVLTDDGTGAGTILGAAVVRQLWDDSDRLVAREDPNGNVTRYVYDSLNRPVVETLADGTDVRTSYDVHDNVLVRQDANGTTLTHAYDLLNRLVEVQVDAGPTVDDHTTFESYTYDGRSLLVGAADDDTDVTRAHDSLGAILAETQKTLALPQRFPVSRTVTYVRDALGNPTLTTYPSGRAVIRAFDGLQRTRAISENSDLLVRFDYLGPDLVRKQVFSIGLQSEYTYDLGRRMIRSRHSVDGELLDEREYGYDESGNKRLDHELSPDGVAGTRQVEHDSLGRSVSSEVTASIALNGEVAYAFDGAGNRTTVIGDACSGAYAQIGQDARVHQYSSTPCEEWSHDAAGNLLQTTATAPAGRDREFTYDHRDRLVAIDIQKNDLSLRFAYDVFGRKVQTWANQGPSKDVRHVYDGWNVIEEYAPAPAPAVVASYLYGDDLDDRLEMRREGSWWYLDDELGSTVAVVSRDEDDQLVVERYAYRDYGEPFIAVDGALKLASIANNPYLFAGGRWLPEARLYDFRTRHFDPVSGRFISRDRLGLWGDEENLGNGYTYVGNTPDTYSDPTGEYKKPHVKNCHSGAREQIEDVLEVAEPMAKKSRQWFDGQAKRKRVPRKKDWTKNRNHGRKWWGKYHNTRFTRIKWNFRKIARRCSDNVLTFKCRSTGKLCGKKTASAWTHSVWTGQIRLCKYDGGGFFKSNGDLGQEAQYLGDTIVHEIAHNINAIGDKKLNGNKMYSESEVVRLAKERPITASWNAANYDNFADTR
jgi:RHS repeat-associated protein